MELINFAFITAFGCIVEYSAIVLHFNNLFPYFDHIADFDIPINRTITFKNKYNCGSLLKFAYFITLPVYNRSVVTLCFNWPSEINLNLPTPIGVELHNYLVTSRSTLCVIFPRQNVPTGMINSLLPQLLMPLNTTLSFAVKISEKYLVTNLPKGSDSPGKYLLSVK